MKNREHSTWLSLVGLLQLIMMASFGFFVGEIQKLERNQWLTYASFLLAMIAMGCVLRIYLIAFKKRKHIK